MKTVAIAVFFAVCASNIYPQSDPYAGGNGSVIETVTRQNTEWTRRVHNQEIQIGYLASPERLTVYSDPMAGNGRELFRLALGDSINISEVVREENTDEAVYRTWLKISAEQGSGWINIGGTSPYLKDQWQIIETLTVNGRQWTVRRQHSMLALWETVDVREKPGFDSAVIFSIVRIPSSDNNGSTYFIEGFAITEETDKAETVPYRDHWVEIEDSRGRTGWIFGGFGSTESGGPKYRTPEAVIDDRLGDI